MPILPKDVVCSPVHCVRQFLPVAPYCTGVRLDYSHISHDPCIVHAHTIHSQVKYSQVPMRGGFTKTTVPRGLLNRHNTKEGTWGVINVSSGKLQYNIHEPAESVHVLEPNKRGIIEPRMYHHVVPLTDDVNFVVEFYRKPGTRPVDEQREGL